MNADQAVALHKAGHVPPNFIFVQQVLDRPFKDDCRNHTKTIWNGLHDIQLYPDHLWPRLSLHPDVWALFDPTAQPEAETEEAQALRLQAEAEKRAADVKAATLARENEAKGEGALIVTATVTPTFEQLQEMPIEELRELAKEANLGLHPRQARTTVIERLIEHWKLSASTDADADAEEGTAADDTQPEA